MRYMPIYEYRCRDCNGISEFLVGVVQERPKMICQYCGSKKLKKIFSQSFISVRERLSNPCGKDFPCDTPSCADDGICRLSHGKGN